MFSFYFILVLFTPQPNFICLHFIRSRRQNTPLRAFNSRRSQCIPLIAHCSTAPQIECNVQKDKNKQKTNKGAANQHMTSCLQDVAVRADRDIQSRPRCCDSDRRKYPGSPHTHLYLKNQLSVHRYLLLETFQHAMEPSKTIEFLSNDQNSARNKTIFTCHFSGGKISSDKIPKTSFCKIKP